MADAAARQLQYEYKAVSVVQNIYFKIGMFENLEFDKSY